MDWRYVSTSNVYDRLFIGLTDADMAPFDHQYGYSESRTYRLMIHLAGTYAYAFDATVLLASLILYACLG